ncbi:MAG: acetate kinase, partial [Leptolyngbyaceae bacterium]|nr:acetate kinase [Leptolyngbyaceae bacterium]
MNILVLNAGSSSQKSCLYALEDQVLPEHAPDPLWEATIDWTARPNAGLMKVTANGVTQETELPTGDRPQALVKLLSTLTNGDTAILTSLSEIHGVGHRVVHGGDE